MWVEILLRFFITLYGLAGLGTFSAYIPKLNKSDDEFVKGNVRDYLFRLLTSIIFFLYAIFVVHNWRLSFLFVVELIVLILAFAWIMYKKKTYLVTQIKRLAQTKRKFF